MTSRKHEGFRVTKRTVVLDFNAESEYYGLEAKVLASVPFDTLFWFQRISENSDTIEALRKFGDDFLMEWNALDDNGKPYPATGEGVLSVPDFNLVNTLMQGWIAAVTNPPTKSSDKSGDSAMSGEQLTEELATSSVSLGS